MAKKQETIKICFGLLAEGIDEQVRMQGYLLPDRERGRLQKCCDYSQYLFIQGMLTDTEYDKINQRILKDITKHITPLRPQPAPEGEG